MKNTSSSQCCVKFQLLFPFTLSKAGNSRCLPVLLLHASKIVQISSHVHQIPGHQCSGSCWEGEGSRACGWKVQQALAKGRGGQLLQSSSSSPELGRSWLGRLQGVPATQNSLWTYLRSGQGIPKSAPGWLHFLAARLQQAWLGHRRVNCYKRLKSSFKIVFLYQ